MSAVAIVQTAFIGDVVLATPLFEAAKKNNPSDRIAAVVRRGCENLIETNPYIDDLIVWDKHGGDKGIKGIMRIAREFRRLGVHTALVPHRSLRSAIAVRLAGVKTRVGFDKGGGRWLHTHRVPHRFGVHEVERNLLLAEELGWDTAGISPLIVPDEHDRQAVSGILDDTGRFCVLAPGSVWTTKKWPTEHYAETAGVFVRRGMTVICSGGPADSRECSAITEAVPGVVDLCGKLTLRQSAELYRNAEFVLTNDSAPQHIAAAMGTWTFAVFGPTIRDFGFWPYSAKGVLIEDTEATCRPCGIHGHMQCPNGDHVCMQRITPEMVVHIIDTHVGTQSTGEIATGER